ncbi:hypothetical protein BH10ACI4_BH10ACI4_20930 [soil metagenome]
MLIDAKDAYLAIRNGEFVPYFQPLVELRTGQLSGFEVLARWNHPEKGMISPIEFIPMAEKDGWIGALGQDLLRKAFAIAAEIPEPLVLAINISPVQLHDLSLPKQIRTASEEMGFPMNRVMVEITESALTGNMEYAMTIAQELKAMGSKLALDDFGTGYSSLLHLQSLPFDELKVDRSFVSSMMERRESRKIVAAVVGLGQSLGLTTVGEGVETQDQAEMLLWMGCGQGQGWLYGRPVPASQVPTVVATLRQKMTSTGLPSPWKGLSSSNLDAFPAQRMAQLQAVYDGAPVGLGFLDRNLRHVSLNRRLAEINGFSVEENLGRSAAEVDPELFLQFEPYVRRALDGEAIKGVAVKKPATDTEAEKAYLMSYQPAWDEGGEVIGVSVAMVDISELKRADDALQESEDQYRHMVGLNPQTPWIMDPEGRKLDVSPQWERTTGVTKEETRDHEWIEELHPEDVQTTMDVIAASVKLEQPINVEYRVKRTDGGWRWMRSWGDPRFNAEGKLVCWSGSVEDIDDRKQMEEALRKSQAQLQAVLAVVPVGVILADAPDGLPSIANPEAKRIFRDPALETLPISAIALPVRAPDEPVVLPELPLERALVHGEATTAEGLLCKRADGTEVWVSLAGAPILDQDGKIAGAVMTIQELDDARLERLRAEADGDTRVSSPLATA